MLSFGDMIREPSSSFSLFIFLFYLLNLYENHRRRFPTRAVNDTVPSRNARWTHLQKDAISTKTRRFQLKEAGRGRPPPSADREDIEKSMEFR